MRDQFFSTRPLFFVALAAAAFACAAFFFLRATQSVAPALANASEESSCVALEKSFVQNQIEQIPLGYPMTTSATGHFDASSDSCMVEMDFRTAFQNGTWGDNYTLFDATRNLILADCFIEGGTNPAAPFCNDDGAAIGGMVPQMPQESFDTLVANSMTE